MSAAIYIKAEAKVVFDRVREMNFYARDEANDKEKLYRRPGYSLKPDLNIQELPAGADIGLSINTKTIDFYQSLIDFPVLLRGCIFSDAPSLPEKYEKIIEYWSHEVKAPTDSNAVYFQNPDNAYMVHLLEDGQGEVHAADPLLSEGIVICIKDLGRLVTEGGLRADQYVEIGVPVDPKVCRGDEPMSDIYGEYVADPLAAERETIFLKVEDILRSPNPDAIYIDLLRYEMLDYGYFY